MISVNLRRGHGTHARYVSGCRCTLCTAANTEYHRDYRAKNGDAIRAYKRSYQKAHPESYAPNWRMRAALRRGCIGSHTTADVRAQYVRQDGRCFWCRSILHGKYHVDHVIPLSAGGSNSRENIVVSCPSCNMTKGSRHPMDFAGVML